MGRRRNREKKNNIDSEPARIEICYTGSQNERDTTKVHINVEDIVSSMDSVNIMSSILQENRIKFLEKLMKWLMDEMLPVSPPFMARLCKSVSSTYRINKKNETMWDTISYKEIEEFLMSKGDEYDGFCKGYKEDREYCELKYKREVINMYETEELSKKIKIINEKKGDQTILEYACMMRQEFIECKDVKLGHLHKQLEEMRQSGIMVSINGKFKIIEKEPKEMLKEATCEAEIELKSSKVLYDEDEFRSIIRALALEPVRKSK